MKQFNALVEPQRCAVLVIDMQNDFVSPGGYHQRQGRSCEPMQAIIPHIRFLLNELPKEAKVIYIVTVREPDGSDYHWRFHKLLPERVRLSGETLGTERNVLRGTWGAEIVDLLKPRPGDHVFIKRRNSAFFQTDLEICLRCWGIDTLIFSGVMADICVESTIRDAFNRDFDIAVVSDGVAARDEDALQAMLRSMADSFGVVMPAEKIKGLFAPCRQK
jgi:ureidoacrylate peracid hydrolase